MVGLVTMMQPGEAHGATGANADALQARVRSELSVFTGWLRTFGVPGFVGEVGWPNNADTGQWNALANKWYADAEAAGVSTTAWSTGEWWGCGYKLAIYTWATCASMDGPLSLAKSQAPVIESRANLNSRGINVSGGEFGTPGPLDSTSSFSNANPGIYDRAYHYDVAQSFTYLASRGMKQVRLPVRWERVQPTLGGPLDANEVQRITAAVGRAQSAGLTVIIDIHNYGAYWLSDGTQGIRQPIGSLSVTVEHFATLWRLLSSSFANNSGVAGYDLMNEPVGMLNSIAWELASQAALTAIRLNGDTKTVMVPGYNWSGAQQWTSQHPLPWIVDTANNFRYEAHHYWDRDSSGAYPNSYASEVANAQSRGFSASPLRPVADFTGDSRTDVSVFRPSNGNWYVKDGASVNWGMNGDIPVPGDYDGNGTSNIAVFRPSNGVWYLNGAAVSAWGASGDIPVPGDYDGNGTTDLAVFRPSNGVWYVNSGAASVWGVSGDIPVPGDYNGDGITDMAVFRPSTGTWFVKGQSPDATTYGASGDIPVPGDYNGDSITDLAVFRPSNGVWYLRGQSPEAKTYGASGDLPVPGDYDGNGTTDLAVFRPSNGIWFLRGQSPEGRAYGASGDTPLPLPDAVRRFFF
ncbi:MAG TPA: cellulase family glycosylhydrolase [Acidimicrobiales bacterium]|nr:cellulase family glycosylhydrolase [Acidimicrobiales bacterium]